MLNVVNYTFNPNYLLTYLLAFVICLIFSFSDYYDEKVKP